jgi:hypothetical protein
MVTTRGNTSPGEVGIGKDLDMSTPPPAPSPVITAPMRAFTL